MNLIINIVYVFSALCFIYGLKLMSIPDKARKGNLISAFGMLCAVFITLLDSGIINFSGILIGIAVGVMTGFLLAHFADKTSLPQIIALFNGLGGLSSFLLGWAIYNGNQNIVFFTGLLIFFTSVTGILTFSGGMLVFIKLTGLIDKKNKLFLISYRKFNLYLIILIILTGIIFSLCEPGIFRYAIFGLIVVFSFFLGFCIVAPIGRNDIYIITALLNSCSGIATCLAGFIIMNNILIIGGSLIGASSVIMTIIMCKSRNYPLKELFFTACKNLGDDSELKGKKVKEISALDAYYLIDSAEKILIVPGFGLAASQCQNVLKELEDILETMGKEIRYAIHPIAGRIPGHINMVLSEAKVSYDKLWDLDKVNAMIHSFDLCIVIGANDIVNPASKDIKDSPLFGMPIIEADRAKTVIVIKRTLNHGFSKVDNPLFYKNNTSMLLGDAKSVLYQIIKEVRSALP